MSRLQTGNPNSYPLVFVVNNGRNILPRFSSDIPFSVSCKVLDIFSSILDACIVSCLPYSIACKAFVIKLVKSHIINIWSERNSETSFSILTEILAFSATLIDEVVSLISCHRFVFAS
jgi:hypothetical protein